MKLALYPQGIVEAAGLLTNLAPSPVPETMFGMALSRLLIAGVRLGVFAQLAEGPATAAALAQALRLDPAGAPHLLDALCAQGHLRRAGGRYHLASRSRRWLDPSSPTYIGTFLEFNADQWDWWTRLEERLQSGRSFDIHAWPADDPRWRRYMTALFELARVSADEVSSHIPVPAGARRVLDVAGGHGAFSARLCARTPGLRARVLDLPGSARAGREILGRFHPGVPVEHVEGDAFHDDLEGPWEVILYFQTLRHFTREQNRTLLARLGGALAPGGLLAVMDYLDPPPDRDPDMGAVVGLHYWLTTGGAGMTAAALREDLCALGLQKVVDRALLRLPHQRLLVYRRG